MPSYCWCPNIFFCIVKKSFQKFPFLFFFVGSELLPLQSLKKKGSCLREEKREKRERLKKSLLKAQKYFGCNE